MINLDWLPFRPKTDEEMLREEERSRKEEKRRESLRENRSKLFRNKEGAELLREWAKNCGFNQSIALNSANATVGNAIDPYKLAFYDGMQQAVKELLKLLDDDLLITILKKDD
jgi:hypothetical protein